MKKLAPLVLAVAVAFAASAAYAQDATGSVSSVQGNVMVSQNGGDYVSASSGTSIGEGSTLTVGTEGSATVVVDGQTLALGPGTYTFDELQRRAAVLASGNGTAVGSVSGPSAGATTGIVLGAALIGAAAIEANGDNQAPIQPISRP
jgi:hypothetical protein